MGLVVKVVAKDVEVCCVNEQTNDRVDFAENRKDVHYSLIENPSLS